MGNLTQRAGDYGLTISSQSISQDATTATALTVPANATSALVSVWGDCAFRTDGTDPTSSSGHPLLTGDNVEIFSSDLASFKVISQSGTVVVFVTYFK